MSRRYKALRMLGVDRLSAFVVASLNDMLDGPETGPVCRIAFLHMVIEIDDHPPGP